MNVLRTPEERFKDLKDWPYKPKYIEIDGMRMHYVDEGPSNADPILLLHGEPTWAYLYRTMIPVLTAAGHRIVAPDFFGFGRSDKPDDPQAYTSDSHTNWTKAFVEKLDLKKINFLGQDWGGNIGLRLMADDPNRFNKVVLSNTFLREGNGWPSDGFKSFWTYMKNAPKIHAGGIMKGAYLNTPPDHVIAAFDAPFPDDSYLAGVRRFPMMVPLEPDHPSTKPHKEAWAKLEKYEKPVLTAFSDKDPVLGMQYKIFQERIPGCKGQPHTTIQGAGHFIQEEKGPELAEVMIDFFK